MVPEFQLNISAGPALSHQLDLDDLYLCRLVLLQLFLLDVAKQRLLVLLQCLVILVLSERGVTRLSISERLTLKF